MSQSGLVKYYWGVGPHSVYTDLLTKDLTELEEAIPVGGNNDANWDQYEDLLEHAHIIGEDMFYLIRHFSWKWCVSHEFSIELTCTGNFNILGRGLRRVCHGIKYLCNNSHKFFLLGREYLFHDSR